MRQVLESLWLCDCPFCVHCRASQGRTNIFGRQIKYLRGFPGGSVVNNPSAMEETLGIQVRSLGQEEPRRRK